GAGFTRGDLDSGSGSSVAQTGFLQAFGLVDALGPLTADWAFRLDFSNAAPDIFSALVGLQRVQGPFVLLGDYAKGLVDSSGADVQTVDLGLRYEPTGQWSLGAKALHQQIF